MGREPLILHELLLAPALQFDPEPNKSRQQEMLRFQLTGVIHKFNGRQSNIFN